MYLAYNLLASTAAIFDDLARSQERQLRHIAAMFWKAVVAAAALVAHDAAAQNVNVGRLLRFSCSQLVIERIDPLVEPGVNPSAHTPPDRGGEFVQRDGELPTSAGPWPQQLDANGRADGPCRTGSADRLKLYQLQLRGGL